MNLSTRRALAVLVVLVLSATACQASVDTATDETATDTAATTTTDDTATATDDTATATAATDTTTGESSEGDPTAFFVDGALTADPTTVPCTLENGSETTCYQLEVASLPDTVATDGPYCPQTVEDVGGIWVWDGDEPGLYALDGDFWALMESQGYEFVDADGTITITDPGAGAADTGATANSCLEATPDDSFHIRILLPKNPEDLDEPTDLSVISQVGIALDGVTIFGDAPSVADRGGLPALDPCGGHIDPSGYYHWHFGAESIQSNLDEAGAQVACAIEQDVEALVGYAFDGHPIYGPSEDGQVPADLDQCSGHISDTSEFGEAYHYHLTYDSPNLPACRIGAAAVGTLSSPDNPDASLPNGDGPGAGGPGNGPPPQAG